MKNKMKSKKFYKELLNKFYNSEKELREAVIEILQAKKKGFKFDWENGEAPSFPSCSFDEDLTDTYIAKIWYDGLVKANLHAYYLADDSEDVDLGDEVAVDWADILDNLLSKLPDNGNKDGDFYHVADLQLYSHLRACYGYRGGPMFNDEDPEYDNIGGMQLCYDEGNEEIRLSDGTFWSELPNEVKHYILDKFMN